MPLKPAAIVIYALNGSIARRCGYLLKQPVFITGTGRCGSTLLAQILHSHPRLIGLPDEANEFWHPRSYPYAEKKIPTEPFVFDPRRFTELSLRNWPAGHDKKIIDAFTGFQFRRGTRRKFFTKSAMTGFMLPKIRELFPDAKFVHLFRNGPAVVDSFLKKEWHKYADYFESEDQYRLCCARLWNETILEIEKQKNKLRLELSGQWLEFSYETLCAEPERTLRELAEFIGVDPAAYRFEFGTVVSTNYKIDGYRDDPRWKPLLEIMAPGMRLKGFL